MPALPLQLWCGACSGDPGGAAQFLLRASQGNLVLFPSLPHFWGPEPHPAALPGLHVGVLASGGLEGAGGHRRELGSFLHIPLRGQRVTQGPGHK